VVTTSCTYCGSKRLQNRKFQQGSMLNYIGSCVRVIVLSVRCNAASLMLMYLGMHCGKN
jgi:hypothetical protein